MTSPITDDGTSHCSTLRTGRRPWPPVRRRTALIHAALALLPLVPSSATTLWELAEHVFPIPAVPWADVPLRTISAMLLVPVLIWITSSKASGAIGIPKGLPRRLITVAAACVVAVAVIAMNTFVTVEIDPVLLRISTQLGSVVLATSVIIGLAARRGLNARALGLGRPRRGDLAVFAAALATFAAGGLLIHTGMLWDGVPEIHRTSAAFFTPWEQAELAVMILNASFVEELVLAGVASAILAERFSRWGWWGAVAVLAAMRVLSHLLISPWQVVSFALAGVVLPLLYRWRRRLWPLIAAHLTYNVINAWASTYWAVGTAAAVGAAVLIAHALRRDRQRAGNR
ncbi:CAAX protease self-immunity [Sinosporangium album]|uniref:CAAX protease self-immunity n=1 Tax=Sinosporangium album TaxID=504805 RepID=A0A1G8L492_9ACTN|nr:CPBP family intramembrane glutamic endopeptidase [Sinosporangium album]SDI50455.1 CAAX protease self-immunity [Sinosporangium album]